MKNKIEYDQEGKPIIPEGYCLVPGKTRQRGTITEEIPAHLRKLRGPAFKREGNRLFSPAMQYNMTNKTLVNGDGQREIAKNILLGVKSEIDWLIDKLVKSL